MAEAPERIGRYELIRRIGQGGMGEVYEALLHGPAGFRKRVALKRLVRRSSPRDTTALAREARLGAMLSHPNVVATWELAQTDGGLLVAMELVQGPSLLELRRRGPLSAMALLDVGVQAAAALAHVHGLSVEGTPARLIHRDVKPGNLLIDPTGLVKLADLGIAALTNDPELSDAPVGTPGFVAPEQVQGAADPRSDLFSLGVVLLWLATGRLPFGSGPSALFAVQQADDQLTTSGLIERVEAGLPGLGPVLWRSLRTRPEDRWADAGAMGAALSALRAACVPGASLAQLVAERFDAERAQEEPGSQPTFTLTGTATSPRAPTNLPPLLRSLIGRSEELQATIDALTRARLVVLQGPAGVGKTRLALEVGRRLRGHFPGGIWRIGLEEVISVEGLCAEVGRVLSVPLTHGDPIEHLGTILSGRAAMLLILDGPERISAALPPVVHRWVGQAPQLRVLVASRRQLPEARERIGLEPLPPSDAVLLLAERAGPALADAGADELRALALALDGLPLAIELAAARAALLSPAQLLARLEDRFRLLTSSGTGRHATLRAAFDDSWELLSPVQQRALVQLTVFAGGWLLEAAEAVLSLGDATPWALDVLQGLVDHSLVRYDRSARRFQILSTVKEHAEIHLDPEQRARARKRHGDHYTQLALLCDPKRDGPRRGDELQQLLAERENLVVALERAIERGDVEVAYRCGRGVAACLAAVGPLAPGVALIQEVLTLSLPAGIEAEVRSTLAHLSLSMGDLQASDHHLERAMVLAHQEGDRALEAVIYLSVGNALRLRGDAAQSRRCLQRAQQLAEALGHQRLLSRAMSDLAILARLEGRLDEADALYQRALSLQGLLRDLRSKASTLNNLGNLRSQQERPCQALYREALDVAEAVGDQALAAVIYSNLSLEADHAGRIEEAMRYLQSALRLHREQGSLPAQIIDLGNLGSFHLSSGELHQARSLLEEGWRLAREHALLPQATVALANLGHLEALEGNAEEGLSYLRRAIALERSAQDHRTATQIVVLLAHVERLLGDLDGALAHAGEAIAWAEAAGDDNIRARATVEWGWALAGLGRAEEASEPLMDAARVLRRPGPNAEFAWSQAVCALILFQTGREAEARAYLRQAEGEARRLELGPRAPVMHELAEIRRVFGAPPGG